MGLPCSIQYFASCSSIRRSIFQQGDLGWGVSRPVMLAVILVAAGVAAVVALLTYRTTGAEHPLRDRLVLDRAADRRPGAVAHLPVPADAHPEGVRPAAELRRRPGRRLAQHEHRGHRRPAAQRLRSGAAVLGTERAPARSPVGALRPAVLQFRVVGRPAAGGGEPEIRRHRHPARAGARARARRALRPAARRPRDGHRRRRHVGRLARRTARTASRRDRFRCSRSASVRSASRKTFR